MNTITLAIKDKEKFLPLLKVLQELDIVEIHPLTEQKGKNHKHDFFKSAGLWKDRSITVEQLREEAWSK